MYKGFLMNKNLTFIQKKKSKGPCNTKHAPSCPHILMRRTDLEILD